ncbi:MAG: hypothetical protein ABI671_06335 [Burkholderiales bacterium]
MPEQAVHRDFAPSGRRVPGPATLGEFVLSNSRGGCPGEECEEWMATLADLTEVVVSDFRGSPSQVGIEKALSIVQSRGYLERRALQLLTPFTKEDGRWRLVTLDFGLDAGRHECEFLMCFAFQRPNCELSITSPCVEVGFDLLGREVSEPVFVLTVKSAVGLWGQERASGR